MAKKEKEVVVKKNNNLLLIVGIVAVIIVAIIVITSVMNNKSNTNNPDSQVNPSATAYNVRILDYSFISVGGSQTMIKVGDSVTWTNEDTVAHSIISDSGNEIDSGNLAKGQTYSHTFNTAGVYTYHCANHPGMKGKVTVQ